ncbi:MAG: hypothetical protein ACYTGQ_06260, partial [Planctomycetota bacterium]
MKTMTTTLSVIALLMTLCVSNTAAASGASVTIEVNAGKHLRVNTPVSFTLPDTMKDAQYFSLTRLSDGAAVPVQRVGPRNPRAVFILSKQLEAKETRRYTLKPLTRPATGNA